MNVTQTVLNDTQEGKPMRLKAPRVVASLIGVVALAMHVSLSAQTTYHTTNEGGGFACFTEKGYDDLLSAIIHGQQTKDYSWAQTLLDGGKCFSMKKGLVVTIIDFNFFSASNVYLHIPGGGAPVAVWTANENFSAK